MSQRLHRFHPPNRSLAWPYYAINNAERYYNLTMAARGVYVEAGNAPGEAAVGLRCHNELLMVIAKQLLRYSSGEPDKGYPDRAFVEVLAQKAKASGCEAGLRRALERALRDGDTGAPRGSTTRAGR